MILLAGAAVRFKGPNSDLNAQEFADSLRGHASCHGSKVVITKVARLKIKISPDGDYDESRLMGLDLVHAGRNGHNGHNGHHRFRL